MDYTEKDYPLHFCAFNNIEMISHLLKGPLIYSIDCKDRYGNTALHIAAMLNNFNICSILLNYNSSFLLRNNEGWRALDEAISTRNEKLIKLFFNYYEEKIKQESESSLNSGVLSLIPDCVLRFHWEMSSWVPLLTRYLPTDKCIVWKRGDLMRFDSSSLDFNNKSWNREKTSVLFDARKPYDERICIINHNKCTYEICDGKMSSKRNNWVEESVYGAIDREIVYWRINLNKIDFTKKKSKQTQFHTSKMFEEKKKKTYRITNVEIVSKKRKEHLTQQSKTFHNALKYKLKRGAIDEALKYNIQKPITMPCEENNQIRKPLCTWTAYKSGSIGAIDSYIGKRPEIKEQTFNLKLSACMTEEINMNLKHLMAIFRMFAPLRKFTKMQDILERDLPPGFPLRLEMPLVPTVIGLLNFESVSTAQLDPTFQIDDSIFEIPKDYTGVI